MSPRHGSWNFWQEKQWWRICHGSKMPLGLIRGDSNTWVTSAIVSVDGCPPSTARHQTTSLCTAAAVCITTKRSSNGCTCWPAMWTTYSVVLFRFNYAMQCPWAYTKRLWNGTPRGWNIQCLGKQKVEYSFWDGWCFNVITNRVLYWISTQPFFFCICELLCLIVQREKTNNGAV